MRSSPIARENSEHRNEPKFTGHGVLILDKPKGLTSHDVVQQVKKKLGGAKVGHSGTLDPFATGVLIVLVNEATKLSPFLVDQEKTYLFKVCFGVETDTQDCTGRVVAQTQSEPLQETVIREACAAFTGEIEQTVPRYSAVRVGGKRLYQLARRGVQVTPPSRKVRIITLSLQQLSWPEATFNVTCSKGTYVRSLGVDLAHYLNCNGHVSELRRLRSGGFHLSQAVTLEQLEEVVSKSELDRLLISQVAALEGYPKLRVSHPAAKRIRQGGVLESAHLIDEYSGKSWPRGPAKVLDPDNQLVAMVVKSADDLPDKEIVFKTLRVFGNISKTQPKFS